MSGQIRVPRELSRVLYKSLLRASRFGRHPEVFGRCGAIVYNAQCENNNDHFSLALPSNPSQVRQRMKSWFRNPIHWNRSNSEIQPLEALRLIREQEEILPHSFGGPTTTKARSSLPIFDCDEVAILPGEKTQMLFIEPRYQHLASVAATSNSKSFLLRRFKASREATLVKILSHMELDNGAIIVTCLGGRRLSILGQGTETIGNENHDDDETDCPAAVTRATSYHWLNDKEMPMWSDDDTTSAAPEFMETRQYILDLLTCVLPNQDRNLPETLEHFGLPPLDPEAFSFWALRLVLPVDDTKSRLKWSFECRSVADRLDYIVDEIESTLDAQEEDTGSFASSM